MKQIEIDLELLQKAATSYPHKRAAAKALGICTETFRNLLIANKIEFVPLRTEKPKQFKRYLEINEKWLIENWVNTTKSIKELAAEIGCSDSLIESRIISFKLKKPSKHSFNVKKFFNILDPHIWYIAGLAATDGHFPKHYDALQFSLVGDDEFALLNAFKTYYESSKEVTKYHTGGKGDWYWIVSYPGLQQFFQDNFNITMENKTFEVSTPNKFPTEDCAKAYIRGCIDGDGSIFADGKIVRVCTASEAFIRGLGKIVEAYTGITYRFFYIAGSGYQTGRLYPAVEWNTSRSKAVLDWVYSLEDCFRLERKYLRYSNRI